MEMLWMSCIADENAMFKIGPYDFVELPGREFSISLGANEIKKGPNKWGLFSFIWRRPDGVPGEIYALPTLAGAQWAIALSDENAMFKIVPYDFVELPTREFSNFSGVRMK
jgi:hypothetical protein